MWSVISRRKARRREEWKWERGGMRGERPICGGWYVIERGGGETCVLVCARDLCGGHPAARDFVQVGARVWRGPVVAAEGNVYGERMQ